MGVSGGVRGCRGVRLYWRAGRECRYSGARWGIGDIRGHLGVLRVLGCCGAIKGASVGVKGVRGVLGVGRECRYSGAKRGIVA